jgi:hypothetical protein
MSKFSKRLRKISKKPRNAFILGQGVGEIDDILEVFSSVFVVGDFSQGLRRKNLIYLEKIENINDIPNVDMVFLDRNSFEKIKDLRAMYKRCHPLIFVEGDINLQRDLVKFLVDDGYLVSDIEKRYHIWKVR